VYIWRVYGLPPQQVVERLRERLSAAASATPAARPAPSISGNALKRLSEVLDTIRKRYNVLLPELRLQEYGVRVVGQSGDKDFAFSTFVPLREGEGYTAPRHELPAHIDLFSSPELSELKRIAVRDGRLYAVASSGEEVEVGRVLKQEEVLKIDNLDEKFESPENLVEVSVKPELFQALRKLADLGVELFIVKEQGRPAMYISLEGVRYIVRVPDAVVERAYVDPHVPDGSFAYFSRAITKSRLPDTTEGGTITTRVYPRESKEVFPMRIVTRQRDGLYYYLYYAPDDPEEASFSPPEEPLVRYHVDSEGAAYMLAALDRESEAVYVLPERDRVSFAGSRYGKDISYLVVVDAPAEAVNQSMLGKVLTLDVRYPRGRFGDFIPVAFKVVEILGAEPLISVGAKEVSLFGACYSYNEVEGSSDEARAVKEKVAQIMELPEKSTHVTMPGAALLGVFQKLNELRKGDSYYGGSEELRVVVKPSGEAEVEVYSVNSRNEKRVVWRETFRAVNPPSAPVELVLDLTSAARSDKIPLVRYDWVYRVEAPVSLLKKATVNLFVQPDGKTAFMRVQVGNASLYSRLT
jgi:hypothetical protein